jgi:hypothetical protein
MQDRWAGKNHDPASRINAFTYTSPGAGDDHEVILI